MSFRHIVRRLAAWISHAFSWYTRFIKSTADRLYIQSGYQINRDLLVTTSYLIPPVSITLILLSIFVYPLPFVLRYVFASTSANLLIGWALVWIMAVLKVRSRVVKFERGLITTLTILIPLLASRASLVEIVDVMSRVERDREIAREWRLILRDVFEGGLDILTALRRSIERVPSPQYADVMGLLIEASRVSDPTAVATVMLLKLDYLIRSRYIRLRGVMQSLTMFVNIYIVFTLFMSFLSTLTALTMAPLGGLTIVRGITLDPNLVLLVSAIGMPILAGLFTYTLIDMTLRGV